MSDLTDIDGLASSKDENPLATGSNEDIISQIDLSDPLTLDLPAYALILMVAERLGPAAVIWNFRDGLKEAIVDVERRYPDGVDPPDGWDSIEEE